MMESRRSLARPHFNRSVTGGLIVNDAEAACLATLRGMGLAQIASYQAVPQIKARRLIPVLTDYIARHEGTTSAISTGGTCRAASRSLSISSAAEYARGISSCVLSM
jgi:hypothetical protein